MSIIKIFNFFLLNSWIYLTVRKQNLSKTVFSAPLDFCNSKSKKVSKISEKYPKKIQKKISFTNQLC